MNSLESQVPHPSTSAVGPMHWRELHQPLLASAFLALTGFGITSTATSQPQILASSLTTTSSGFSVRQDKTASGAIFELRRRTGLTWDEMARLFGVSRRSIHFWASGKPMNARNEEKLFRILETIRAVDRGSSRANRANLLRTNENGERPFDLLADHEYEKVLMILGTGPSTARPRLSPLAPEAEAARRPLSPVSLLEAYQDRIQTDDGRLVAVKPIRVNKEK